MPLQPIITSINREIGMKYQWLSSPPQFLWNCPMQQMIWVIGDHILGGYPVESSQELAFYQ